MSEDKFLNENMGQFFGIGPKNYRRSDAKIFEDVCEELTCHPDIDASEIVVYVKDGLVRLSGCVPTRGCKDRAEECAFYVPGVKAVENFLQLGSLCLRLSQL